MKQKVLFIDRDGTLIKEPSDEQIDAFEKLVFYPKALQSLSKISNLSSANVSISTYTPP